MHKIEPTLPWHRAEQYGNDVVFGDTRRHLHSTTAVVWIKRTFSNRLEEPYCITLLVKSEIIDAVDITYFCSSPSQSR